MSKPDPTAQHGAAEAQPEPADPVSPAHAPLTLAPATRTAVLPGFGEVIQSGLTNNNYTIGKKIGEGHFSVVYACVDDWNNDLAAKVLKPKGSYEAVQESAQQEMQKLFQLRHPHITYVFDFFEYRDTFYIITERCGHCLAEFFTTDWFNGPVWILPIARSLLQAVHFLHLGGFVHQDIHSANVFALLARNEMDPSKSESTVTRQNFRRDPTRGGAW